MKTETATQAASEYSNRSYVDGLDGESTFKGFLAGAKWREEQSDWISVDKELPEDRTYILAYITNGGYISTAEYKHGCWFKELDRLNEVTHWQSLPKPPER